MSGVQATQISGFYQGWVRHRRFAPMSHRFKRPIFMSYFDLDEVDKLFTKHWFCSFKRFNFWSFYPEDYLAQDTTDKNLQQRALAVIKNDAKKKQLTAPEIEKIFIMTHLRCLGFIFNPVTFFYCFNKENQLVSIIAEITNTPWMERHAYVFYPNSQQIEINKGYSFKFDKAFHISPFNPMNLFYDWRFSLPNEKCLVHMKCDLKSEDPDTNESPSRHFDATLVMKRQPMSRFSRILTQYPFMSFSVVWNIYWQAFKLRLKKAPFFNHPGFKSN